MTRIIICDSDCASVLALTELVHLKYPGIDIRSAETSSLAGRLLQRFNPGIVFFNLELSGAFEFLDLAKKNSCDIVAMISNNIEARIAVQWLKLDYIVKPFEAEMIEPVLENILSDNPIKIYL